MIDIRLKIQECLQKEITQFFLKGKGAVNNAYYVETVDGSAYIVKQELEVKEFQPQNSLLVEAGVAEHLYNKNLSVPIPHVVFISENPPMYGYEYIKGDVLRTVWNKLSDEEKISVCRSLGVFHAEIGKMVTKEEAQSLGVTIDGSSHLHPEVLADYNRLIIDPAVPQEFKDVVQKAKDIFDSTLDETVFQFIHNDAHHENIIIHDKQISAIIDFGNAEYGELAKEFSRYIRDFPYHFMHIITAYENTSGKKLSYKRHVSNALISGFVDNVEDYAKGGEQRLAAEKAISIYKDLLG